jgi:hypothetical protein
MARKTIGAAPLTNAEKQARFRQRKKEQGLKAKLTYSDPNDRPLPWLRAEDIARERFEKALKGRLQQAVKDNEPDEAIWALWGYLEKKLDEYRFSHSGFVCNECLDDQAEARRRNQEAASSSSKAAKSKVTIK